MIDLLQDEETPLTVRLRLVSANSGRPVAGHTIRLWHCGGDREVRFTDDAGWAEFENAFPTILTGLWPHIHFAVDTLTPHQTITAKLTLPADACLQAYGESTLTMADLAAAARDGTPLAMACVTGDRQRGFVATRTLAI